MFNFSDSNVLESALLDSATRPLKGSKHFGPAHYSTTTVHDPDTGLFYLLVTFNSLVLVTADVCIRVKSLQTPHEPFKFRFWLHANFVKHNIGQQTEVVPVGSFKLSLQDYTLTSTEIKRGASVLKAPDKRVGRQDDKAESTDPSGHQLVSQLASGFKSMSFSYQKYLVREGLWVAKEATEQDFNENVDSDSDSADERAAGRTVNESKGSALKR